ncbi:MAG TPA: DUF2752 domain-containing protein [Candidatus Saccharimonadales bacterium]|nr:DUF2752 domain-containing protein [Candidatus Saccharimonadales bacterium]
MGALFFIGILAGLVLFFFPPETTRYYPKCLLYATTGLQCPGCGGLRAAHHFLHGHFATAFRYNPLVFVLIPLFAFFSFCYIYLRWTGRAVRHPFKSPAWVWVLVGGILLFSLLRNINGFLHYRG